MTRISIFLCIVFAQMVFISHSAQAAIVYYDIPDQVLDADTGGDNPAIWFDFDAVTMNDAYQDNTFSGYDVVIGLYQGKNPTFGTVGDWRVFIDVETGIPVQRFSYNEEINGSLAFSEGLVSTSAGAGIIDPEQYPDSDWYGDTGLETTYIGFANDVVQKQVWVGIRFNDATDTLTITDFAVADFSDNFKAGAVRTC